MLDSIAGDSYGQCPYAKIAEKLEKISRKRPIGILHDVIVKVESFIFPTDFVILDYEVDFEVPNILGRSFPATGRALVDSEKGQNKFWLNNAEETFNICRSMRQSGELRSVSAISY